MRKTICTVLILVLALTAVGGCGKKELSEEDMKAAEVVNPADLDALSTEAAVWENDAKRGFYFRKNVPYTTSKAEERTLNVYVPAAYMDVTKNENGGYTAKVNKKGQAGAYTAVSAPVFLAVFGNDRSGQNAADEPDAEEIKKYTDMGYIYVFPGYRGGVKDENVTEQGGIPWSVAEIKAVIRFLRYWEDLPGDKSKLLAVGDGTIVSVLGTSGDSALFFDYLESIGAVMKYSDQTYIHDDIQAAICVNPGLPADVADGAYEWLVGQYVTEGCRADGTFFGALSDDLAESYGVYINEIGFQTKDDGKLSLNKDSEGIYTRGSYAMALQKMLRRATGNSEMMLSDYAALYLLGSVVDRVGYYDAVRLEDATEYNALYGDIDGVYRHFDTMILQLLQLYEDKYVNLPEYDPLYMEIFAEDIAALDKVGIDAELRGQIYNPLYYLKDYYGGAASAKVCPKWMIISDVTRVDASFIGGANLFFALSEKEGTKVSFSTARGDTEDILRERIEKMDKLLQK